ncbi:MAG: haloacid dehalogenase [Herpetosiphonaceae bacterium]|nr:MAG: haloacid dehalogenase [Herpetosiphonaceae bacterium]
MFDVIAFDADDTLWHNETIFTVTQDKFRQLVEPYLRSSWTGQELFETEVRNLRYFGYGIKGFVLSMIETAIEMTGGQIPSHEIRKIIDFGKAMLDTPVQLLDHVERVIPALVRSYTLMIITKGDLFDQETKIAKSGLAEYFTHIEILSDKTTKTYQAVFNKYGIDPQRFMMVGNSLRSDILPVIALGACAVHIPYHVTWAHEIVSHHEIGDLQYFELEHIGLLPGLIESLTRAPGVKTRRRRAKGVHHG